MKASVILAHPYERSFNHAIFNMAIQALRDLKVEVFAHDLYEEDFNPVMTKEELGKQETTDSLVLQCTREMIESDLLVFIHPNWWGQPPAMMKGYIDRIFRPPYAYDYDEKKEGDPGIPKLMGKRAVVFNTGNTSEEREEQIFHDPLEYEWGACVLGFCGIKNYERRVFRIVANSDEVQRKAWLDEVVVVLQECLRPKEH